MEIEREFLKVDENPQMSPTRFSVLSSCHKKYWFNYVLHASYSVPVNVAIGTLMHKIIENMWVRERTSGHLIPGYKDKKTCENIAVGNWKFNFARTGVAQNGKPIEWTVYDGHGYAKSLIERIRQTAGIAYESEMNWPPIKVELPIEVEYKGFKLFSRIDGLKKGLDGKGIVIMDHKSGPERIESPNPDEISYFVQKNMQLTFNAIVLFEALNHKYTIISDIFPEYNGIRLDEYLRILTVGLNDIFPRKENGIVRTTSKFYPSRRTRHDFDDAVESIQIGLGALRRKEFDANKGAQCNYCFFRKICDDYTPADYHKNEHQRQYSLFAGQGIVLEDPKPMKKKGRAYQGYFRNWIQKEEGN